MVIRLRGHLMRLVNLSVTSKVDQQDTTVAELVANRHAIRCEELPGENFKAVGHVHRMAWNLGYQCLEAAA